MITSASLTSLDAIGLPRGPICPAFSLWLNGMASPWPADVTIGIFNNSANFITSLYFPIYLIPPPAMMTVFLELLIIFTAFFI